MELEAAELTNVFARNLRRRRQELGLTQEQLAERTGISAPDISDMERGERPPKLSTIARIAEGLTLSPSHLLSAELFTVAAENPANRA